MNGLIVNPFNPAPKDIVTQTKKGTPIQNEQTGIANWEKTQFSDFEKKYPQAEPRCAPTGIFNCHGLTFASRRTSISESDEVRKILKEDDYVVIKNEDALPGDIIVYEGDKGDFSHSGIVVEKPDAMFGFPKIVSKWGKFKELIHFANNCPYDYLKAKIYRIHK